MCSGEQHETRSRDWGANLCKKVFFFFLTRSPWRGSYEAIFYGCQDSKNSRWISGHFIQILLWQSFEYPQVLSGCCQPTSQLPKLEQEEVSKSPTGNQHYQWSNTITTTTVSRVVLQRQPVPLLLLVLERYHVTSSPLSCFNNALL